VSESIGNAWGQSHALITVYRVELERGELGAAIASIQRCLELGEQGGFAYAAIATRADLSRVMTYLGDGERGLALAEESLAIARERVPPALSIARVSEALALISLGRRDEAHAPLDEVDLMMLPEPDRTFLRVASSAARARLALLDGDVEEAEAVARSVIEELRTNEVEILMAGALVVLARALLAADRLDEADHELVHGIARAEELGERRVLWEALALSADLHTRRGALREAADLRSRARAIVDEIEAGLPEPDLRRRFLARDDVRALEGA
jgi:tetratricopeptide (TPR) repeat protein